MLDGAKSFREPMHRSRGARLTLPPVRPGSFHHHRLIVFFVGPTLHRLEENIFAKWQRLGQLCDHVASQSPKSVTGNWGAKPEL